LRQALADANDGDTIDFAVTGTIGLTSGELVVDKNITISGPGSEVLAVDGKAMSRVFHIGSGTIVDISGLTIRNGMPPGIDYGGGIYTDHAFLTLSSCTVSGDAATSGGGIFNNGSSGRASMEINYCIFTNNSAYVRGGAIYTSGDSGSASLVLSACTLAVTLPVQVVASTMTTPSSR
jgi:predicted outer membrane repeat protein